MTITVSGTTLTFNDSTTMTTAATGTVTSVATGNGLTGGTITTSGTISLDVYTGSAFNFTSYSIGSYLFLSQISGNPNLNATTALFTPTTVNPSFGYFGASAGSGSVAISGTWRSRGLNSTEFFGLFQRTA